LSYMRISELIHTYYYGLNQSLHFETILNIMRSLWLSPFLNSWQLRMRKHNLNAMSWEIIDFKNKVFSALSYCCVYLILNCQLFINGLLNYNLFYRLKWMKKQRKWEKIHKATLFIKNFSINQWYMWLLM